MKPLTRLALAMTFALQPAASALAQETSPFRAGAGRAEIVLPGDLFPYQGFVAEADPLKVRALLLDDGATRAALLVVDVTSLGSDLPTAFASLVSEATGVPAANVLVQASHTFSAPHVASEGARVEAGDRAKADGFRAAVEAAVRGAAEAAAQDLQPARMGHGQGAVDVNINRMAPYPAGWWFGADPHGFSDDILGLVEFAAVDGTPIAFVLNYAVQSAVMSGSISARGGPVVSADLAGAATDRVEEQTGAVALFSVGAAGDQVPSYVANRTATGASGEVEQVDIGDAGLALVALQGERLAAEALRVAEATQPGEAAPSLSLTADRVEVTGQQMPDSPATLRPVTRYTYVRTGPAEVPVWILRIGPVAIAALQPELSARTGAQIRALSPVPGTMVATMVNGAAKYMAAAEDYDRFTYMAINSGYAKGAAEIVAARIVALLAR